MPRGGAPGPQEHVTLVSFPVQGAWPSESGSGGLGCILAVPLLCFGTRWLCNLAQP